MRPFGGPLLALLVVLSALLAGCVQAEPPKRALLDASDQYVDVSDLSRIVATSHDLVEILFELGHGARVVGVPKWIDHPPGPWPEGIEPVNGTPVHLGRPHVLNVEEILAVDPSIVLLKDHPLQPTDLATGLRAAGVPVFVFHNDETLDNIHYTYKTVAWILESVDPEVEALANEHRFALNEDLRAIRSAVAKSELRPAALYQLPASFVAGSGTSADLLLELAGARNIAADAGLQGYQQISKEVIAEGDPERIVAEFTAASSPDVFFASPRYAETTATRLGPETLRIVDPATTALVGPRFLEGVREVAVWLHPVPFGIFDAELTVAQSGERIEVTAVAWGNETETFTYRFDAGDRTEPKDGTSGSFTHTYPGPGTYHAKLLIIDDAGRIHEIRRTLEV